MAKTANNTTKMTPQMQELINKVETLELRARAAEARGRITQASRDLAKLTAEK